MIYGRWEGGYRSLSLYFSSIDDKRKGGHNLKAKQKKEEDQLHYALSPYLSL